MHKIIVIGLLLISGYVFGKSKECTIEAEGIGILSFDIEGCIVFGDLEHKKGDLSGTFQASLKPLKTGISLRDSHMHEKYLKSDKFPTVKFVLDPLKIGSEEFTGKLNLSGVEKEISGKVLASSKESLKASFRIDVTDFGMEVPGYEGFSIGKFINVTVSL